MKVGVKQNRTKVGGALQQKGVLTRVSATHKSQFILYKTRLENDHKDFRIYGSG